MQCHLAEPYDRCLVLEGQRTQLRMDGFKKHDLLKCVGAADANWYGATNGCCSNAEEAFFISLFEYWIGAKEAGSFCAADAYWFCLYWIVAKDAYCFRGDEYIG